MVLEKLTVYSVTSSCTCSSSPRKSPSISMSYNNPLQPTAAQCYTFLIVIVLLCDMEMAKVGSFITSKQHFTIQIRFTGLLEIRGQSFLTRTPCVYYSVQQCVAVYSTDQCVVLASFITSVCCRVLPCVAVCCSVLHCVARVLQCLTLAYFITSVCYSVW